MTDSTDYEIVGSYNNQRISSIDSERTVNLFEYLDLKGKKSKSLINTSGLINTGILFAGAIGGFRQEFVFNNVTYNVVGQNVYSINSSDAVSFLGTLTTSTGYVGIDANTFQVIFVDGAKGYIWDTKANTFELITDPAFPLTPIDVCNLDGFFIVANGGTNQFQLSMFDNGLIWGADNNGTETTFTMAGGSPDIVMTYSGGSIANYQIGTPVVFSGGSLPAELIAGTTYYVKAIINPTTITVSATNGGTVITSVSGGSGSLTNNGALQLGTITTHPGNIVACRTLHRRLFLFSNNFTEVWENAGIGTNLPFRRNNSLLMEYGTAAIGSISVSFDMMVFLSQSKDGLGAVMQVMGTESMPISNRALDFQLAQYAALGQVADCRGFLLKENGIIFYRMNFTLANHTFVYNVTFSNPQVEEEKRWHEEEVLNHDRHPAQTHVYFNGINYVGHYALPILYILDSQTYNNDGESIRRMRITRPICPPGYQRLRIDRLQIDLLQGNIAEIQQNETELDLATESGLLITTELGEDLLLEQGQPLTTPLTTPYCFFSISKDGGQTYGYITKLPMGQIGQRTFRTLLRKLGTTKRGQAFVTKYEFYDQIPIIILGASWCMELLPE